MKEKREDDFSDFQSPNEASMQRLIDSLDRAYHRPYLMMFRSFLHGFMAAIGAFVGTALMGALSVYLFQLSGGLEATKHFINDISGSLSGIQHSISGEENR